MRLTPLFFLFSTLSLFGVQESSFSADQIIVNDKSLSLSGNIVLMHPLGKLKLEGAEITTKSSRFDSGIQNVIFDYPGSLELHDGSLFTSAKGEINLQDTQAHFTSAKEQVKFHLKPSSTTLTCDELDFTWTSAPPFLISSMSAKNSIQLLKDDLFSITADSATFIQSVESENQIDGTFSIFGKHSDCVLKSDRATIQAPQIDFKTTQSELSFTSPTGTYNTTVHDTSDEKRLLFSVDSSVWNINTQELSLGANATITISNLGTLFLNEGFSMKKNPSSEIPSFTTMGKSTILHEKGIEIHAEAGTKFHETNSVFTAHGSSPIHIRQDCFEIQATDISFRLSKETVSEITFSNDVQLTANDLALSCAKIHFDRVNNRIELYPDQNGTINSSLQNTILPIQLNRLVIEKDPLTQEIIASCIGRTHLVIETEQKNQLREMVTQCKTLLCLE